MIYIFYRVIIFNLCYIKFCSIIIIQEIKVYSNFEYEILKENISISIILFIDLFLLKIKK